MASVTQTQTSSDPLVELLADFGKRYIAMDAAFFRFSLAEQQVAVFITFNLRHRNRHRILEVTTLVTSPAGTQQQVTSYPYSAIERDKSGITIDPHLWVGATGSRGSIGPMSWDLVFEACSPLLDPQVTGGVRPFDLRMQSVPDALISGNVTINQHRYSFSHESGMVGAYYGRRFPDHLYWLSANDFPEQEVALECAVMDSTIFGLPFTKMVVGYFHLRTPETTMTIMHPLTGHIAVQGNREHLVITARSRHIAPVTARFTAAADHFQSLDDSMLITLIGSCEIAPFGRSSTHVLQSQRSIAIAERVKKSR